jgi:hypothetical protein
MRSHVGREEMTSFEIKMKKRATLIEVGEENGMTGRECFERPRWSWA